MMTVEIDQIVEPIMLLATVNGVTIYAATGFTIDQRPVTVFAKAPAGAQPPSVRDRIHWSTDLSLLVRGGTLGESV